MIVRLWTLCAVVGLGLAGGVAQGRAETAAAGEIARLAREVVPAERWLPFDDARRAAMDYLPLTTRDDPGGGVRLGRLGGPERVRLHELLRAVLGDEGALRVQAIRSLEDRLREQGEDGAVRVADAYAARVYGELDDGRDGQGAPWAVQFDGHHVSVNATAVEGELRLTPLFLGANPATVGHGPDLGLRVLASHEDQARALLESLSEDQRSRAMVGPFAWSRTIQPGTPAAPEAAGLSARDMDPDQRRQLRELVATYARNVRRDVAEQELARLDAAGIEALWFAWYGENAPDEPSSYVVRGPTVVLRFDRLQDPGSAAPNHVHALWSDPERDFGLDLLQRHYAQHDHGADTGR